MGIDSHEYREFYGRIPAKGVAILRAMPEFAAAEKEGPVYSDDVDDDAREAELMRFDPCGMSPGVSEDGFASGFEGDEPFDLDNKFVFAGFGFLEIEGAMYVFLHGNGITAYRFGNDETGGGGHDFLRDHTETIRAIDVWLSVMMRLVVQLYLRKIDGMAGGKRAAPGDDTASSDVSKHPEFAAQMAPLDVAMLTCWAGGVDRGSRDTVQNLNKAVGTCFAINPHDIRCEEYSYVS